MPLVAGAVAPHGFPIIPDLSEDAEGGLATREAMFEMGRHFAAAKPDVIFIVGPHGVRVNGFVSIADVGRGAGTLHYGGKTVEMNIPVDLEFSTEIAERARAKGVPVAGVGYGASSPKSSVLPLDWGIITPIWFAGHQRNQVGYGNVLARPERAPGLVDEGPAVVIANPSRMIPREVNVLVGQAVAEAAEASDKRVAIIASCDWAHSHTENGPYGYHPDAKRMDEIVVQAIKDNEPGRLIDLDDQFVRNSAIDGLWQLLMLAGAMEVVPMDVNFLSYEAPTYYGMIVATYTPRREG
jgi:aromatic ring-opening dioxygenase LigB subunit